MRIKLESELLDLETRKKIIQEIKGAANKSRKDLAYKRYQCYKDKTKRYVVENLTAQLDQETVKEMRYCISNISIVKKITDKLARVYSNGVERSIQGDDAATKSLQTLVKALDFNTAMKKANRFLKLQKNLDFYVKPCPVMVDGVQKWTIKLEPQNPHHYDAVEDFYDRTKPLCFILSDYQPPADILTRLYGSDSLSQPVANSVAATDTVIADSATSNGLGERETFIFWSKSYHFTCYDDGSFVAGTDPLNVANPLVAENNINFAIEQDNAFWAEGGDDIVDGGIFLNSMITHNNHVGIIQGYGQFYMIGENLPTTFKIGPTKALRLTYKKDDQAEPKAGFLNANPQLDSLQKMIEAYVALLLTTNNLSTTGISAQLAGGVSLPSGIALMIDKAESLEDVQDQRQIFLDKEPCIWKAINAILIAYGDNLVEDLQGLVLPEDFEDKLIIKFNEAPQIQTETEKLTNLQLRKDLGIDTEISILMKEDPSLTADQAEEKFLAILEQRIEIKMMEQKVAQEKGFVPDVTVGNNPDQNLDPNKPNGPPNESNPNNGQ